MKIYQADQHFVKFKITQDGEAVTPDNVDGVRIYLGGVVQEYPKGLLSFDGEHWLFYLQADKSAHFPENAPCQIEIKRGDVRQHSAVFTADVAKSLLKGDW